MNTLLKLTLATSTSQVYRRAWVLCQECMNDLGLQSIDVNSLPLTTTQLLTYLSYLSLKGLAPSTITTYISAVGYVHKMNSLPDPTNSFVIQKVLAAINRSQKTCDSRLPITQFLLNRLLDATELVVTDLYQRHLTKAMFALAFYGLFRIGEITIQTSGIVPLSLKQVQVSNDKVIISITDFKHNKTNKPFDIVIHKVGGQFCPYLILIHYLVLRGCKPGPLFCFSNQKHIPRSFFTSKLKCCLNFCGLNTRLYLSHSFRIGGASYLASLGLSDVQIKLMGRWSSDSFLRYIRNQRYHVSK